jgi:hypothetical protein
MILEKGITLLIKDTYLYGDVCADVRIVQQVDPLSIELPISTSSLTLINAKGYVDLFKEKEKISIFFDGKEKATMIIKKIQNVEQNKWTVSCEDWVSLLEDSTWYGDTYTEVNVVELLSKAFEDAKIPYEIDSFFNDKTVSGVIDIVTARNAVMNICFAIGAYVDTSEDGILKIKKISDEIQQSIPPERIFQGAKAVEKDVVTSIGVETFGKRSFADSNVEGTVLEPRVNRIEKGMIAEYYFTEPHGAYTVWRATPHGNYNEAPSSYYRFLEKTSYHVKVEYLKDDDSHNYPITARKYGDFEKQLFVKENILNTNEKKRNDVRITTARLVNSNNVEEILERIFPYLSQNEELQYKILEGKNVKENGYYLYGEKPYGSIKYGSEKPSNISYDEPIRLGELIEIDTEHHGKKIKRLVKQSYSLNGNIIIKDCVLK